MSVAARGSRRPRVLQVAYACGPGRGSEPGTGWNRAVEAARSFDVWVICEGGEFAGPIRRYLEAHGPIPGLEFAFVFKRGYELCLQRVPGLYYFVYNLWHRRAFREAKRLHEQLAFDLVHQVNISGFREPGYLGKLDAPLVWGPVGGTQNYPWRFLPEAGPLGAVSEALRNIVNSLQLRLSPRVRSAARKAAAVLASSSTNRLDLGRALGIAATVLSDVGIEEIFGREEMVGAEELGRPPSPPAPLPHAGEGSEEAALRRAGEGSEEAALRYVGEGSKEAGGLRLLWCGELSPRKALSLLIKALARLPNDVPYALRVAGDGRLRSRWQRLARRTGVAAHTEMLGKLPRPDVLDQYRWADVFVFTSLRDTTGTVVLEALAAGLPVICLDHQGAHDVVTEQCGIRIPVGTPGQVVDGLRDAIVALARDPDRRRQLAAGAMARAEEYSWSRNGEQLAAIYRQVLARPR
jgi:glycosyltransferase involved in cell wall biosynthesis